MEFSKNPQLIHMRSDIDEEVFCDRVEVPDGWIVRTFFRGTDSVSVHQIFIADPHHTWRFKENQPGQ